MILNSKKIKQMKDDYTSRAGETLMGDLNVGVFTLSDCKHRLLLPVSGSVGERVRIYLTISFMGKEGEYAQTVLTDEDGNIVDYGFLHCKSHPVFFNATVIEENNQTFVSAYLVGGKGERVTVFGAQIIGKPLEQKTFFGGGKLTMMEQTSHQSMGFLYQTKNGKLIVIDGGEVTDTEPLAQAIAERGGEVAAWFISHYHSDHIRAVIGVIEQYDVKIDAFYYDFRGLASPDFVGDEDVVYARVLESTLATHPDKVQRVCALERGTQVQVDEVTVTALNDGYFGGGENAGNDSSVALKMQTGGDSVLFLGDLGLRGDAYLEDEWFLAEMRSCKVLQMAHHGQNGVSQKFYNAIDDIDLCLYTAAQWLFDVEIEGKGIGSGPWQTLVTRDWMRERGVEWSVTVIDGRATIE